MQLRFDNRNPHRHFRFDSPLFGGFGGFAGARVIVTTTQHEQGGKQQGFDTHQSPPLSGSAWPGSHAMHSLRYWHHAQCIPGCGL